MTFVRQKVRSTCGSVSPPGAAPRIGPAAPEAVRASDYPFTIIAIRSTTRRRPPRETSIIRARCGAEDDQFDPTLVAGLKELQGAQPAQPDKGHSFRS